MPSGKAAERCSGAAAGGSPEAQLSGRTNAAMALSPLSVSREVGASRDSCLGPSALGLTGEKRSLMRCGASSRVRFDLR